MSSGVQDLGPNTASNGSYPLNPVSSYYVIDDFTWGNQQTAPYGPFGFVATGAAGGALSTQSNIPATATITGRIGLQPFGLGTSNNATANASFFSDGLSLYAGQVTTATLDFGFYVPTASDGTNTYIMELGFRNSFNSGAANNSMVIKYDSANSANWRAYTSRGGTGTTVDSGLAVVGTSWYNGRIVVTAASAVYSIASPGGAYTQIGSVTTQLPSSANASYLCFMIYKNATFAVNRFMVVDWVSLTTSLNR